MNKFKEKMTLNPVMTFLILILLTILLSGFLNLIGFEATYNKINVDTGEYIEIDIEDLELPKRADACNKKHQENLRELNNQRVIINKKQDHKEKGELYSDNEKALIKAMQDFYAKEEEALDEFIGEGATRKLLAGRKPYLSMFEDINEYMGQIAPILKEHQENLIERIKSKYGKQEEDNVL